jgi:hypothetical protein
MNGVAIADIGVFSWTHLSARHVKSAETQFSDSTLKIHAEMSSQPQFAVLRADLRGKVSDYVKQIEAKRIQEFLAYQKAENAKREQKLEAQFQENLKRMSEAEAEKLRKLEEEKQELIKQQRDQEARHRATLEQQQAALKAQLEQEERHHQAMLAAQARAAEEQREHFNQLRTVHEESMARMEREREQERAAAARRDAALQAQIRQIQNQMNDSSSGGCQVC